ncbi:unnamed protein product [Ilex paraguariensis]|uniref:Protein FLX-like 2 n=1 Tax=Ilex paraguariensis TaxID=185542 RepID=A0ABC8UXW1_9AQUA
MGSKGRLPPPHLRRPLPGFGMVHPDPFGPGIRTPPGAFPPFDMLPPPEVMEQKLAAQHVEMQKLATENQRLAATHGNLRQELAAAQHELQMLHAHTGAVKSEREQQMRGLMEKIAKIESELQAAEPIKMELQQARADAQSLILARQELISKGQQLTQDHQRVHSDVQQIPALMSELESLRQEYQHCRITYDYEKKLYTDHLESLQVMEKNYMAMAREVEKLRAELANAANLDRRTGGPYGGTTGYDENDATGHHPVGQGAYGVSQGRGPLPAGGSGGGAAATAAAAFGGAPNVGAQSGLSPNTGYDAQRAAGGPGYDIQRVAGGPSYDSQRGAGGPGYDAQKGPGYDVHRGPSYDMQRGPGYDVQRAPGYDAQKGPGYDVQTVPGYDAQRGPSYDVQRGSSYDTHKLTGYDGQRGPVYDAQSGPGYETQRGPGYDPQRGPNYDTSKGTGYDASSRGAVGPQGQVAPANNALYGSATMPTLAGSGYEAAPRGGNPVRR